MGYSVKTDEVRMFPDDWSRPVEHHPLLTKVMVAGNEHAAMKVTLMVGRSLSDKTGYGVEFDLTPKAARRLAEMLCDQAAVAES